jgi:membrane protease subunit HflC
MAFRSSTSVSGALTCLSKTARPSISACRPSASARQQNFAPRAAQRAQEIRSRADREVTVLVAEATSKSEQIRGEGDAIRNQIFADAFNQDQDFFAFYRSMQAYEHGLKSTDTRMLLKPDSSFFRYFSDPSGKARDRVAPSSGQAPAR